MEQEEGYGRNGWYDVCVGDLTHFMVSKVGEWC